MGVTGSYKADNKANAKVNANANVKVNVQSHAKRAQELSDSDGTDQHCCGAGPVASGQPSTRS